MTYQQNIVALRLFMKQMKAIDKDYKSQLGRSTVLFQECDYELIENCIDAFKTLDDMGNTMKKLLTERSNSYETVL